MAAIDSAYQYYLSTYGNSTVSRYDTHKKSQLRDTYNKIVKTNKESPLYKIKTLGKRKNMRLISRKVSETSSISQLHFQAAARALKKLFPKRSPSLRTKMS